MKKKSLYGKDIIISNFDAIDLEPVLHEDSLFIDDCCHLNEKGNKIVADVFKKVIDRYVKN